jgi:hypothetical protein
MKCQYTIHEKGFIYDIQEQKYSISISFASLTEELKPADHKKEVKRYRGDILRRHRQTKVTSYNVHTLLAKQNIKTQKMKINVQI